MRKSDEDRLVQKGLYVFWNYINISAFLLCNSNGE